MTFWLQQNLTKNNKEKKKDNPNNILPYLKDTLPDHRMDEDAKTWYNPDKPYQYSPLYSMGLKYKNALTDMQYKGLYHDNWDHQNRNV